MAYHPFALAFALPLACDDATSTPPPDTDAVVDSSDTDPIDSDTDPSDTDPLDTDPVIDTFHTGMIEVVVLVRMPEETEYHRDTRSLRRIYWGPNYRAWNDTCGGQRALGSDGGCYYSPRWSSSYSDDPWFLDSRFIEDGFCSGAPDEPFRLSVTPEDAWMTCCDGEGWGTTDCTGVPPCCGSW